MKALEKLVGKSALKKATGYGKVLQICGGQVQVTRNTDFTLPPDWKHFEMVGWEVGAEKSEYTIPILRLAHLAPHMAEMDVRYYLNGLAVYADGSLCATTGHSLAMYSEDGDLPQSPECIIPRELITLALSINKKEKTIRFVRDHTCVSFDVGEYRFTSKLIDGKYPDASRVITVKGEAITADYNGAPKGLAEKVRKVLKRDFIAYYQGQTAAILPCDEASPVLDVIKSIKEKLDYEEIQLPPLFSVGISQGDDKHNARGVFDLRLLDKCAPGQAKISRELMRLSHGDGLHTVVMPMRYKLPKNFSL